MGLSPIALYDAVCKDVGQHLVEGNPLDRVGLSYKQFASSSLAYNIVRKWIPKESSEQDLAACRSFMLANNKCGAWKLPELSLLDSVLFNMVVKEIDDFCHPGGCPLVGSYFDVLRRSRPGPGVAVGAIATSYYTKYMASQLSTTSRYLYEEYKRYTEWIPTFDEAEAVRRQLCGEVRIVAGSRVRFVPKTSATSRMICVEPSLNMFYQLGLGDILTDRLASHFNVRLDSQPLVNQALARRGSIDGTLCTIDLSSASDSISYNLVKALFPKWFFELLCELRSPYTFIDDVGYVPLQMISTMGNGFTFPLQTIIFSALLRAVSKFHNGTVGSCGTWSCFGDDLICDSYCYPTVIRLLTLLGFTPNPAKSFSEGPFRESCGADWFLGQPVRPVFVKKLDLPFDYLVAINQLNEWTAYTGIPLWNTIKLLKSFLRRRFLIYVPLDSPNDSGIRVPLSFIHPKYNRNLSFVYKTWERKPSTIRIGEGEIRLPTGRRCPYNPAGLYASFLFGELVDYSIMVRHDLKYYRTRRRVTPCWDHIPTGRLANGVSLSQQQWKTALVMNFS